MDPSSVDKHREADLAFLRSLASRTDLRARRLMWAFLDCELPSLIAGKPTGRESEGVWPINYLHPDHKKDAAFIETHLPGHRAFLMSGVEGPCDCLHEHNHKDGCA
jgi:hypothetical protein